MSHRSRHITLLRDAIGRSKKNLSVMQEWTPDPAPKAEERKPISRRELRLSNLSQDSRGDGS